MANHIAAIHVLKSKLQLSDDDYRALIKSITLKTSTKDMTDKERQAVRDHMQGLAVRMGVAKPSSRRAAPRSFAQAKAQASPRRENLPGQARQGWPLRPAARAYRPFASPQRTPAFLPEGRPRRRPP